MKETLFKAANWMEERAKYLQPQAKQEWSEEDEENLNWFEKFFRAESVIAEGKDIPQDRYLWFKNLKDRVQPKQEWNEEDEERLSDAIFFVREYQIPTRNKKLLEAAKKAEEWLKSLIPQNKWKPSEEQMVALKHAFNDCSIAFADMKILATLYEQLKALHRYEQDT